MVTQVKEKNTLLIPSSQGVTRKPFGLSYPELIALTLSLVALAGVVVYYYSTLRPEQADLKSLKQQIDSLARTEAELQKATNEDKKKQEDVAKGALESLENFKTIHLKRLSQGRIALIDAINSLAKKDGIRLTSGIAMTANKVDVNSNEDIKGVRKKGFDSLSSVFPSLKINFTVAGEYKNLREFINDLEANKQFVTINAVTLTSIKEKEAGSGGRSSGRRSAQVLTGISLAIDMTAYFQS